MANPCHRRRHRLPKHPNVKEDPFRKFVWTALPGCVLATHSSARNRAALAFKQNAKTGRGRTILGADPVWKTCESTRMKARHFALLKAAGSKLPDTEGPTGAGNRIIVRSVGIKAWSARTANVRLEYCFKGVGQLSVGAFRRDCENLCADTVIRAAPESCELYGIDGTTYGGNDVAPRQNIPAPCEPPASASATSSPSPFRPGGFVGCRCSPTPTRSARPVRQPRSFPARPLPLRQRAQRELRR